jgi:hypothetical protein
VPRVVKSIAFFDHLAARQQDECERHYLNVHVPFILQTLQAVGIAQSYYTSRVLAQRDLNGGWCQQPDNWRSVAIRVRIPDDGAAISEHTRLLIEDDHRRFLRNLRSDLCAETVLHEDLRQRPSTSKFILAIGPGSQDNAAGMEAMLEELIGEVTSRARTEPGTALMIANRVRRQERARPLDEPGQGFTPGDFLPSADLTFIYELYFDSRRNGESFIAQLDPALTKLREAGGVHSVRCFRLDEECQYDRRLLPDGQDQPSASVVGA